MKAFLKFLAVSLTIAGMASPAAGTSSQYPFRYGFPDQPIYSYNPYLYWSYASQQSVLDQRTLHRWQGYSGPNMTSAIDPGSYGSPATAARIQSNFGFPFVDDEEAPRRVFPYTW